MKYLFLLSLMVIGAALAGSVSVVPNNTVMGNISGATAPPTAQTAPVVASLTAISLNATGAAPYQFAGSTVLAFPTDTGTQSQTLVGIQAGASISSSVIDTVCVGYQ